MTIQPTGGAMAAQLRAAADAQQRVQEAAREAAQDVADRKAAQADQEAPVDQEPQETPK